MNSTLPRTIVAASLLLACSPLLIANADWTYPPSISLAELREQVSAVAPQHPRLLVHKDDLKQLRQFSSEDPVRQAMVARPGDYPRSSAAWWEGSGDAHLPLCQRPDLPFGVSLEALRRELLRFQSEKRLDDVLEAFEKTGLSRHTAEGRSKLEQLLRDAGLDPWI